MPYLRMKKISTFIYTLFGSSDTNNESALVVEDSFRELFNSLNENLQPPENVVNTIIDYSKSVSFVKTKSVDCAELFLN